MLQSTQTDRDGDGRIDMETRYDYDTEGRLRATVTDSDLDGTADRITTHAWRGAQRRCGCP